jgi:hypothetical protein
MSITPSTVELISDAIGARLEDVHVALPGKVTAYDAARQLVDVQPQVKRVVYNEDGEKTLETLPVIPAVPLGFPRGGGYMVTFPVAPGDFVLLVMCDRSIDAFMQSGNVADPGDERLHGLQNAVAYPGVYPAGHALSDAHASNMVVGKTGGNQIHITSAGVLVGNVAASHPMLLGDVTETWLQTHTHPTGTGPSGPPSQPTTGILSTKHKLDG